jgi:hypothetical protein
LDFDIVDVLCCTEVDHQFRPVLMITSTSVEEHKTQY